MDEILQQPKDTRPIAVIHAIEGGHSLGYHLASDDEVMQNLEAFHRHGVICLTLAHFYRNRVVPPCYPFPEDIARLAANPELWRDLTEGLTDLGEKVVERMIELGMLIDISHCTPPARARIYDIVGNRTPILASHVGAYEINPDPYNLKDWEIKRIADGGGLIGVILMNFWLMPRESNRGLNFITRTMDHMVNVAGVDHVGFGSDFDGFTDPPDDLKDASQLPHLTQRLLAAGYGREAIQKILGGNALRVLMDGWKR